jgi:hypothetical protein
MVLSEQATTVARRLSLVVLGSGRGADMIYSGIVSTSYVLCLDRDPLLLVGLGPGATRQCLSTFGRLPRCVFVHSNRTHFAAELPVVVSVEAANIKQHGDGPMRIFSDEEVLRRLEVHRLAELCDVLTFQGRRLEDVCLMCQVPPCRSDVSRAQPVPAAELLRSTFHGSGEEFQLVLRSFRAATTEHSCGFTLFLRCGQCEEYALLTVVGDSSYDESLLDRHVATATVAVVDGRATKSLCDHAHLGEIYDYAHTLASCGTSQKQLTEDTAMQVALRRLVIGQFGPEADAPTAAFLRGPKRKAEDDSPCEEWGIHVVPGVVGLVIPLALDEVFTTMQASPLVTSSIHGGSGESKNSSAPRRKRHFDPERPSSPVATGVGPSGHQRLRLFFFENKSSQQSGELIMAHTVRSVQQLRLRASEALSIKPVGHIHIMPSGRAITTLSDVYASLKPGGADVVLVVTRNGGEKFSMSALPPAVLAICPPPTADPSSAGKPPRASRQQSAPTRLPSPPRTPSLPLPVAIHLGPDGQAMSPKVAAAVEDDRRSPALPFSSAVVPAIPKETARCTEYIQSAEGALSTLMKLLEKGNYVSDGRHTYQFRDQPPHAAAVATESGIDLEKSNGILHQLPSGGRLVRFTSIN